MVQLSHPYMTTGKTIALTIQTFFGNVMTLIGIYGPPVVDFTSTTPQQSTLSFFKTSRMVSWAPWKPSPLIIIYTQNEG